MCFSRQDGQATAIGKCGARLSSDGGRSVTLGDGHPAVAQCSFIAHRQRQTVGKSKQIPIGPDAGTVATQHFTHLASSMATVLGTMLSPVRRTIS